MTKGLIRGGAALLSAVVIAFFVLAGVLELRLPYDLWYLKFLLPPFLTGMAVNRFLWGALAAWVVTLVAATVAGFASDPYQLSLWDRFLAILFSVFSLAAIALGLLGPLATRRLAQAVHTPS